MTHIIYEMGSYEEMATALSKRIVKGLSKWAMMADTCNKLLSGWNSDMMTDDIIATVNLAVWEAITQDPGSVTIASSVRSKKLFIWLSDDTHRNVSSAVQSLIMKAKGIQGELFVDDFEGDYDEDKVVSSSDKAEYIRALERHMTRRSKDAVIARIQYVLDWIDLEKKRTDKTKRMLKAVAVLLASGYKLNSEDENSEPTISDVLGIDRQDAYYYSKELKKVHQKHNPIVRKVFTYIKMEYDRHDEESGKMVKDTYWQKVTETEADEECEGKKRKVKVFFLNGVQVFPMERTRPRRYVINKSKHAFREAEYITTYRPTENSSPDFRGLPAVKRSDAVIGVTEYNPFTARPTEDTSHEYKHGTPTYDTDRTEPMKNHPVSGFSPFDVANTRKAYSSDVSATYKPRHNDKKFDAVPVPHTVRLLYTQNNGSQVSELVDKFTATRKYHKK